SWGINPETTHDCGNPKDGYLKLGVWSGFPEKWPTAYAAVQKMNLTNLDVAQLAMYVDIDGMEPEDAAALWLADNCARWTGWSGADASVCPAAPEGPEGIRIAVVAPSASNDLAFSQSIVDGVNALSGVDEISITDGTFIVDDAAAAVRDYAEDGYDLVIAHGSQYGGFLSEMAPDFPDTAFAWGTSGDTFGLDNVSAYTASSDQGGYVMGAMAAAMTYSRVIGVVGPIEVGDAKLYVDGFVAGAAAQDPGVSVNVNYIMSFSDVALAAEAAQAHVANGADILTGTAQMVVGATGVAAEHGAKWFGTQSNQTALGEDMVVASQVYKWEVVLQGIVDDIAGGDLGGEAHDINLGNGGIVIEFNDGVDAGDARAIADAAIAAVIAGGVDTTYTPPQPKSGGTLVQASTQVGANVNHGVNSGVGVGNPSSKIFASLVHLDANWQPQPYLAESWEVSEDQLTVTLNLVDGATFHDGVPITSADVKFSIEVIQTNHPFTGMWGALESIDTPDDLTVVLNLANAHPALWIAMSDVLMPVMPKHIMDDGTPINEMKGHPNNTAGLEGDLITVGSGPFVLTEWDNTQKIVLEAYEDFFIPDRPYLDKLIYVIVPDEDAAMVGLESGEYDTAGYASVLNEEKVLNNPDLISIPYAGGVGPLNHLQFNMSNDIISDLRVRQAIAYTIDRDYVTQVLHQGMTEELLGGIHPDSPFYNPNVERYDVDLDKARALLAEAGYADGLELRIHYIPGPNEQQLHVAEYIAAALSEVGVDAEVAQSADLPSWAGIFFGGPDAWHMTMNAYFNWGDPVIGVQRAYVCANIKPGVFVNNSAYCNEQVDELLYAAAAEPDFDARKALYDEFQEITAVELPFYGINALPIFGARQPEVMNLPKGPWGNLSGMENVWLDR
ncbi:MAG: ABC transporter substrate-binding protein, partial [Acidimicrobiales bacterium]|nr:ABC transporter substrate-binding protein [Acidimicrobiales bacterium]